MLNDLDKSINETWFTHIRTLEGLARNYKQKCVALETKVAQFEQQVSRLERTSGPCIPPSDLEAENEKLKEVLNQKDQQLVSVETTSKALVVALRRHERLHNELVSERTRLADEAARLEERVASIENENAQRQAEAERLVRSNQQEIERLKELCDTLTFELSEADQKHTISRPEVKDEDLDAPIAGTTSEGLGSLKQEHPNVALKPQEDVIDLTLEEDAGLLCSAEIPTARRAKLQNLRSSVDTKFPPSAGRSFSRPYISSILGGNLQGCINENYFAFNLEGNVWLPTKPGHHGYVFVGLEGKLNDAEIGREPKIIDLFVGLGPKAWHYMGLYEFLLVPGEEWLSTEEWLSMPNTFKNKYARIAHTRYNRTAESMRSAFDSGIVKVPVRQVRAVSYNAGIYEVLAPTPTKLVKKRRAGEASEDDDDDYTPESDNEMKKQRQIAKS